MRCAIFGCNSDNQSKKYPCEKSVKFHRFPKNADLCKQWLHASKRNDKVNFKNAVVCSKHFLDSDYKMNLRHRLLNYAPKNYRGLKDDAVPTQNLPQTQIAIVASPSTSAQHRKLLNEKRQRAQIVNEILATRDTVVEEIHEIVDDNSTDGSQRNVDNILAEGSSFCDKGTQTDDVNDDLQRKLEIQNKEIEKLRNQLAGIRKIFSKNKVNKPQQTQDWP